MKYLFLLLSCFGVRESSFRRDPIPTQSVGVNLSVESLITKKLLECNYDSTTIQVIIAQAKFESGNFSNRLTREHNNLFGMRHPRVRPTKSLGPHARAEGRNGYASFASIEDSVEDFVLYLEFCKYPNRITNVDEYTKLLKKKKYFESSQRKYSQGIKHYLNGTKKNL